MSKYKRSSSCFAVLILILKSQQNAFIWFIIYFTKNTRTAIVASIGTWNSKVLVQTEESEIRLENTLWFRWQSRFGVI